LSLLSPRQVSVHWFTDPHIPWKVPLRCLQVFAAPTEAISNGNARTLFISQKNNDSKDIASCDLLCMCIYMYSLCTYRLSRWQVGGGRRRRPPQRDSSVNAAPLVAQWSPYVEEEWAGRWSQVSDEFGQYTCICREIGGHDSEKFCLLQKMP
jgi:hypothetical protein